jgi:hypothetical protein
MAQRPAPPAVMQQQQQQQQGGEILHSHNIISSDIRLPHSLASQTDNMLWAVKVRPPGQAANRPHREQPTDCDGAVC